MNGHSIKIVILASIGAVGGYINMMFSKHNGAILSLIVFMSVDYVIGIIAACVFKKSKKSANGGLNSSIGWRGLCKKVISLLLVLMSERIDLLMQTSIIQEGITFAFIANELLSIVENAGMIGIPIPKVLVNAVDVLQNKNR